MSKHYLLAVDGGATKTTIALQDDSGKLIFETTASSSNYQTVGIAQVTNVLTDLLKQVVNYTPTINSAVFAIAGIDTPYDLRCVKAIVDASVSSSGLEINFTSVENDVEATLLGLTKDQPGAILISGTGALSFAYNGEQMFRAGGWGHRIGDEGSGYWIGQQIARAIMRTEDGLSHEQSLLTKLVFEKLDIQHIDAFINWIYAEDYTNARLASLVSTLAPALEAEDTLAELIATEAAYELALLCTTAFRKANLSATAFTLYLNGGVLLNNPRITEEVIERVQSYYPKVTFVICDQPPILAIVERAKWLFEMQAKI